MTALLVSYSDAELLAELDARAKAASPPAVHFFGVWPGRPNGHFTWTPEGRQLAREPRVLRRGYLYPIDTRDRWREEQPEGIFWHWRDSELTLLTSWDRSADRRGGCCAAFVVYRPMDATQALALARAAFPAVFARIETHLGRDVVLGGPTDDGGAT